MKNKIPSFLSKITGIKHLRIDGNCSGIYFLLDDSEVVYIGQSRNVLNRIVCHIQENNKKFGIDNIFYLPASFDKLNDLEKGYIEFFKPRYNSNGENNMFVSIKKQRLYRAKKRAITNLRFVGYTIEKTTGVFQVEAITEREIRKIRFVLDEISEKDRLEVQQFISHASNITKEIWCYLPSRNFKIEVVD